MRSSFLALVANDQCVADAIRMAVGQPAPCYSFTSFREHLEPDVTGTLLFAPMQAQDIERLYSAVQEIRLRQLPITAIALCNAATESHALWRDLDPELEGRWVWPRDRDAFLEHRGPPLPISDEAHGIDGPGVMARRLLAATPSLQSLAGPIALAARHEVPVLISGQRGVGRSYLAWVIHRCSSRSEQPFVQLACTEIPPWTFEQGWCGASMDGAGQHLISRDGNSLLPAGGTAVLDEVELLGKEHQARLLGLLERAEAERTAGSEVSPTLARIVTISSGLEEATARGWFRRDLSYRLQGVTFHLPELRQRRDDIAPLTGLMAAESCQLFGKRIMSIATETLEVLQNYAWPGNVRQLRTVIQQAILIADGAVLQPEHLPLSLREPIERRRFARATLSVPTPTNGQDLGERLLIQRTLQMCGNNRTRAAQALGISRVTLYKKLRKHFLLSEAEPTAR